jgi:hypothetical protein
MFDLGKVDSTESKSPLKPGEKVKVELISVDINSESGNLELTFKGKDPDNAGIYKHSFWANNFDTNDQNYKKERADNELQKIKQVAEAYLTEAEVANIKGTNFAQFAASFKANVIPTKFKGVETFIKVIYKKDSDDFVTFPMYGEFISTTHRPRGLKLRTDKKAFDENGIPYERVKTLSEYGVKPATTTGDMPFGQTSAPPAAFSAPSEDIPAFKADAGA